MLHTCNRCEGMGRITITRDGYLTTITCPECMGQGNAEIEIDNTEADKSAEGYGWEL